MTRPDLDAYARSLNGGPLDLMKTIAVFTMVLESANFVLFDNRYGLPWYIDRVTFPIFCFASAVHIARGFDFRGQVATLAVLGVVAQPFHALAFPGYGGANVLVTLAIGAALAGSLASRPPWQGDAVIALVAALNIALPAAISGGWEYGMLGAVLPLAFASGLKHGGIRLLWPVVVLTVMYAMNDFAKPEALRIPGLDIAFAVVGTALVILAGQMMVGRPRFLHRYALHVVYPGHLAVLVGLRLLMGG
ncbi:MAG TPA: TraX family protein [Beijerinckiaceae bacterium]|nr:TraX family protein [Beijerinckiaceae bacterium]